VTSQAPTASRSAILASYATTHLLVDAVCVTLVFSAVNAPLFGPAGTWALVVTYNVLAFGTQVFFGILVDRWRMPRGSAAVGALIAASAVPLAEFSPALAIGLAGLGNALFHVGAGAVSLELTPGRATAPGIFVAPGHLGLVLGAAAGQSAPSLRWPLALLLVGACAVSAWPQTPSTEYRRPITAPRTRRLELVLVLLLGAIVIRSLIGLTAPFPWKTDVVLLATLAVAVTAGKALGGILADRWGWLPVALTALLASLPLLAFGSQTPSLAIAGMFLFQMPTAVALAAIARLFPGKPAFSFGLSCLALMIGVIPAFTELKPVIGSQWPMFVLILAAATALGIGLRWLPRVANNAPEHGAAGCSAPDKINHRPAAPPAPRAAAPGAS